MKYLLEISVDGIVVKMDLEQVGNYNRFDAEKVASRITAKLDGDYYQLTEQEEWVRWLVAQIHQV